MECQIKVSFRCARPSHEPPQGCASHAAPRSEDSPLKLLSGMSQSGGVRVRVRWCREAWRAG